MKMWMRFLVVSVSSAAAVVVASAESAVRKTIDFSITADVGVGNEVCVVGTHPLLGGGNSVRAPKLAWSAGNVWRGKIALEAGAQFSYQMMIRNYAAGAWGDETNGIPIGPMAAVNSPAHSAPPWATKCVLYRSGFAQARMMFRDVTHGGPWSDVAMRAIGPGRTAAEKTFRVDGLAPSGSELEFIFHDGAGHYDNAPAPPQAPAQGPAPAIPAPYANLQAPYNYRTPLDVFIVQDGSVFKEMPPATLSAPRFETRMVASSVAGIPGRTVTILLPRGYDENQAKRYPVVYFHDGQNVFFPGGGFGTWDADRIANYETSQGRMREAILVAVPNNSNRLSEYLPDGDSITEAGVTYQGNAAAYARFLLDHVMPTLDFHYRTLTSPGDTLVIGSSMGGLVSDWIGFTHSGRFGGVGIFSPAYWTAPNWVAQRDAAGMLPLRRYLYMGSAEGETHWRNALRAYDGWLADGHRLQDDLFFSGGVGEGHNEAAWSRNLPGFFHFALHPWREGNRLAQELFPPQVELLHASAGQAVIRYTGLYGTVQTMQQGGDLVNWTDHAMPAEQELWGAREVTFPLPQPRPVKWFWRMRQDAWPP